MFFFFSGLSSRETNEQSPTILAFNIGLCRWWLLLQALQGFSYIWISLSFWSTFWETALLERCWKKLLFALKKRSVFRNILFHEEKKNHVLYYSAWIPGCMCVLGFGFSGHASPLRSKSLLSSWLCMIPSSSARDRTWSHC